MDLQACREKLKTILEGHSKRPLIVAVTGYGAAGKTTLSRDFGDDCTYFPTDGYIKAERTHTAAHPDSVDTQRLEADLNSLLDGQTITPPENRHNNEPVHPIQRKEFIILDGIPAGFVHADVTVALIVDEDEERRRRLSRDKERGRNPEHGFAARRAGIERYILPNADITIRSRRDGYFFL